jgi:hypothetical protein
MNIMMVQSVGIHSAAKLAFNADRIALLRQWPQQQYSQYTLGACTEGHSKKHGRGIAKQCR